MDLTLNDEQVFALCKGDANSIQRVFTQHESLTKKSGLVLNADKIEIFVLNSNLARTYEVRYMLNLQTFKSLDTCFLALE